MSISRRPGACPIADALILVQVGGRCFCWDATNSRIVSRLESDDLQPARDVDGRSVVGHQEAPPSVTRWDLATGRIRRELRGHTDNTHGFAFGPDGTRHATTGGDTIRIWDAISGMELLAIEVDGTFPQVAFSPDGRALAASGERDDVRLWGTATRDTSTIAVRER